MAISLTGSGITVGGTATNIITTLGSTLLGYGYTDMTLTASEGYSYTMTNPGVGGLTSAARYANDSTQATLPSGGVYLATSYTKTSTSAYGDHLKHTLRLSPTSGGVYPGGTSFSKSDSSYAFVFVLALRLA